MIVRRSLDPRWLSNTWLVADRAGGHGVLIDGGAPDAPIEAHIAELGVSITHLLCTHHHVDHVLHNADYRARHGCAVCGHALERARFPLLGDGGVRLDRELADGDEIASGDLRVRTLHVPGHTEGQLAFLVDGRRVFTGDTLFSGSVGGTRAPGHGTFEQLRASILDVLMKLPRDTIVHPGHMDETTIGREQDHNPFVRAWSGRDAIGTKRCVALGQPATLLVQARDYDGGSKCQVRFDADGRVDVVPGSRVTVD